MVSPLSSVNFIFQLIVFQSSDYRQRVQNLPSLHLFTQYPQLDPTENYVSIHRSRKDTPASRINNTLPNTNCTAVENTWDFKALFFAHDPDIAFGKPLRVSITSECLDLLFVKSWAHKNQSSLLPLDKDPKLSSQMDFCKLLWFLWAPTLQRW